MVNASLMLRAFAAAVMFVGVSLIGADGGSATVGATQVSSAVVDSSVTETSHLQVNPDGSLTWQQSTVPVRVRRDGGWVAADATLVRRLDGTIGPRAAMVDMSLSVGGSQPLATVTEDDVTLSWWWPSALPAPVLSGEKAVYPEVFDGVDLQILATTSGFSQVLLVKSAQAARNPALDRLDIGVQVDGGTLGVALHGELVVKDTAGRVVLAGGPSSMWDSGGSKSTANPRLGGQAGDGSALGVGDQVAAVSVTATSTRVSIVPDQTLLDSPTTVFPVMIDPQLSGSTPLRVMVSPSYQTTNWTGSQGVGYVVENGTPVTKRLLWQFDLPAQVQGAVVSQATFTAKETWAYSCTPKQVDLWRTAPFTAAATWASQPANVSLASSRTVAYGWPQCTAGPDRSPYPTDVAFDATSVVANVVAEAQSSVFLKLQSPNESDPYYWKRFDGAATLTVTFNRPPNVPTGLVVSAGGVSPSCGFGPLPPAQGGRPVISTTASPVTVQVGAVGSDVDGGSVQVFFDWYMYGLAEGEGHGAAGAPQSLPTPAAQTSGSSFATTFAPTDQGVYGVHARTFDGTTWSATSAPCEIEVDNSPPPDPPTISSDGQVFAGEPAPLILTSSAQTTQFEWWTVENATHRWVEAANGQATISPITGTTLTVYAIAHSRSNQSAEGAATFAPTPVPAELVARWRFNETSQAATVAVAAMGPDLTVPAGSLGAAAGNDGYPDGALTVTSGQAGSVSQPLPGLSAGIVTALRVMSDSSGPMVSLDGTSQAALTVSANATTYQVRVLSGTGALTATAAKGPAGSWDDLLVSYRPPTATAVGSVQIWQRHGAGSQLYTAGAVTIPAGSTPPSLAVGPTGQLRVGAIKTTGGVSATFTGAIDDLNVWTGFVTATNPSIGTWL